MKSSQLAFELHLLCKWKVDQCCLSLSPGFVYKLNNRFAKFLVALVVALITSLDQPLRFLFTVHHLPGLNPWTELQNLTQNPVEVSSLDHHTFYSWESGCIALTVCNRCAASHFPCVTSALIRQDLFCSKILVSVFTLFSSIQEFCCLWLVYHCRNPLPFHPSAYIVQRTVDVFMYFPPYSVLFYKIVA